MRLYYAQNKEDLFIKAFFPDVEKGFYIDVGANDPVHDSVTKLLYDQGWRGINIEPIERHFKALKRERPDDITLQIGLSDRSGELTFTEYPEGDGLSTFDESMREHYKKDQHNFPTAKVKEYTVPVRTLQEVIEDAKPEHIHFIKIDVEGYEYQVIKGYDWKKLRPELICIEANHINKDWRPLLEKHDYELVFFDGINNYYLAKESLQRKEHFNYPDTVFAGNPVYYAAAQEIRDAQAREGTEQAQKRQEELVNKLKDQEQQIAALHRQQRDVRFLAKQLARETQTRINKRAKGAVVSSHLKYRPDPEVSRLLNQEADNEADLLKRVHELDRKNIHHQRPTVTDKTKPLAWKAAAGGMRAAVKIAKKARHVR